MILWTISLLTSLSRWTSMRMGRDFEIVNGAPEVRVQ